VACLSAAGAASIFPKVGMPPMNAFWSVTMYNAEYFFVDNPLNRYTLSSIIKGTWKPPAVRPAS
jgi:hypothetical protein